MARLKPDRMSAGTHHPGFIEGDSSPDQSLWVAVIAHAVNDYALFRTARTEAIRALSEDAKEWLFGPDDADLVEVCDHAGLRPEFVRGVATRLLAEHADWDWRHDGAYVVAMKLLPRDQCKQSRQTRTSQSESVQLLLPIAHSF